jgi:DNA mismatch repair protein MutS
LSCEKLQQLQTVLSSAIRDEPPPTPEDFVRPGYSAIYDAHVQARDQAAICMEDVTAQLRTDTGISNLKLKSSGGGFFIEVPSASARLIPDSWMKIAGRGLRYKPQQLMKLEASAAAASADASAVAEALWSEIVAAVSQCHKELCAAAEAAADVDVLQALAEVAGARGHVRPKVVEGGSGAVWDVSDGRHFVIENLMQKRGACFIPNSCKLTHPASVMLLSGANMGGKSTFLRQNALIAILAQTGASVPASSATISVVDRLYCRVGALS